MITLATKYERIKAGDMLLGIVTNSVLLVVETKEHPKYPETVVEYICLLLDIDHDYHKVRTIGGIESWDISDYNDAWKVIKSSSR